MKASALSLATPTNGTSSGQGGVTEIIQHSAQVALSPLLLPMLARLSEQPRWLALVAPPAELTREQLEGAGVRLDRTWILRPDESHNHLDLACRALEARTCHTVVSWVTSSDEQQLEQLRHSAEAGDCQGVLLRSH